MRLEKYYIDVVTEAGAGAYMHAATVELGGIRFSACATMQFDHTGPLPPNTAWHACEISDRAGVLHFGRLPNMDGDVIVRPRNVGSAIELFRTDTGGVQWEAIACDADVSAILRGVELNGRGYAERLVMTIPPWSMPIERHWWGRTITDDISIVWLVWEGPVPLSIGVVNGQPAQHIEVTAERVIVDGYMIHHGTPTVLSAGSVMTNKLRALRPIASLLPFGQWDLDEQRWVCRSEVIDTSNGIVRGPGWTMHECITWKGRT
jgi:hypothetical protein